MKIKLLRLISFVLCVALVLPLVGCSDRVAPANVSETFKGAVSTEEYESAEEAAVAFVAKEVELGNKIFGLSNHIWDESVKGASGWYSKQTITKAEEAKASLAKAPASLKCLFGAESEYFHCHDRLGMSVEGAKRFDYLLIPHSHST